MTNHKNPKIHKSWKYNQSLPLKINQETSQNLETENKQQNLGNSTKIPEQNSKNLDKNSSLETSHQIITVPMQTLAKKEEAKISVWSKSGFLGNRVARFSNKTMAILALVLAFSSILGMAFLANSNNDVLKSANAQQSEPDITSADIANLPVYCNIIVTAGGEFVGNTASCSTSAFNGKKIPNNLKFQIGNSQISENCQDNGYGTITYCQNVSYDLNLRNDPNKINYKKIIEENSSLTDKNRQFSVGISNVPIFGILGSNSPVEFKGNSWQNTKLSKASSDAERGLGNGTTVRNGTIFINGGKTGPDVYLEVDNADQRDDTDSNYKIFEANGAVIKESEFVACKKNSQMLSGATANFEYIVCFFPNAQAKRNQIQNKEKNGATLWCPKGWEFTDYDNSIVSQSGQGCYIGKDNSKYNEYSTKIDNGQIRKELPNIDSSKIETANIPDYLKNVKVPDYLSDGVLGKFGQCQMQDRTPTEFQKKEGLVDSQIYCNQIDNQKIAQNTTCPSGWIIHNYTVYDDLTKDGTKLYACKTVAKFDNLLDLFQLNNGKIVKKYGGNNANNMQNPGQNGNSQTGNNNDKICAQVQTVGQNVNNRQEIKQFPNSCLPDGFEKITDQMVAAVAFRMSDCAKEGDNGVTVCKKIDGRVITKALDCPKGWTGGETKTSWNWGNIEVNAAAENSNPSTGFCILKNSLWGENLSKLIKLENGLLKDAGSTSNSNQGNGKTTETKLSDKNIAPTTDLLEEITKSNDINTAKCNNLSAIEKRTCQAQALQTTIQERYEQCEKDDKSKWCDQDPGDLKIGIIAPASQENSACNPESDMEGKMRPLNDQQCGDRKKGYKGPFNFQTRGKQGTRNCWYFGKKDTKYGCDNFGYLKTTCDLIGRYASSNPDQDFGAPDCKVAVVPTTQEANTIARGVSTIEKTEINGTPGFIAKDLMPNPRNFTECFEPSETKGGFAKNNTYCNAGGGISVPTPSIPTAWINLGIINVFAAVTPVGSTTGIVARGTATVSATATAAVATGGGAGFNIKGLDLLGINCLFTDENGKDSECLVNRITTFLRNLSYPLAILVLIWAGYQYFIGGVDGKTNGLKAVQAVIWGVLIIGGATFFVDTVLKPTATSGFTDTKAIAELINNLRAFLVGLSSSVAILVIMWGGYKFFFSGLDWEKEGGLKAIKNATIGLAIILIANTMVETLTNLGKAIGEKGDFVKGVTDIIKPFLTDITSLLFGIASLMAVLVIVWGGYKYFFSGLEISKKDGMDNIRNGVIGLVTVILASQIVAIVKTVVPETPAPSGSFLNINATGFYPLFTSLVNGFLVPISTACAVFFMIMGGFYWTTSNGDENKIKKAKKALINAIIGLVIVILAVSIIQIVRFLVGGLNIGGTSAPSSSVTNFVEKWF
jgi:Type IV secretion system pilin/TrbC/VIRB2 pilin